MAAFGSFALLVAIGAGRLQSAGRQSGIAPDCDRTAPRLLRRSGWPIPARRGRNRRVCGRLRGGILRLVWAVFANDFSITYIVEHSNRALPGA